VALELEAVVQRYEFDIRDFEANITRAQQRLNVFQRGSERAGSGQRNLDKSIRQTATTTAQGEPAHRQLQFAERTCYGHASIGWS
jgi:hypothetical protein